MGFAPVIIGGLILYSIASIIFEELVRGRRGYVDRSASPIPLWLVISLRCGIFLVVLLPKQSISIVKVEIEDRVLTLTKS